MPTDREKGKFPEPCPSCGAARWVEDVCACPLPATEKPAEAREVFAQAGQQVCGVWALGGHGISCDLLAGHAGLHCDRMGEDFELAVDPKDNALASTLPQAQPEETPKRIGGLTEQEIRQAFLYWIPTGAMRLFDEILSAAFSRQGER